MYRFMEEFYAKPDESLALHTERLQECLRVLIAFGYIKDEKMKREGYIALRDHDLGKINPSFQYRVTSTKRVSFHQDQEVGHNILSAFLVDLKQEVEEEYAYCRIVNAVLNHHHYVDNYREIGEKRELLKKMLNEIQNSVPEIREYGFREKDALFNRIDRFIWEGVQSISQTTRAKLLKGFLHKCDYAASARMPIEFKNDFLQDCMQGMGYHWNELQSDCIRNRDKNLFITASTGMGKTEAALLWLGDGKGIYVLPLQVAINAIYDRIKGGIIRNEHTDKRLGLLHGNTLTVYLDRMFEEKKEYGSSKELSIATMENEKFFHCYENTKNMALPLTITTPDQILDFVYRYEGYELKLATLSYSKVIIDEIQAYSPDLLAYLVYGIKQIVKAGGKFAIFTATLPPFVKDLLKKAYQGAFDELEEEESKFGDSLERDRDEIFEKQFFSEQDRHHLEITQGRMEIEDIKRVYERKEEKKILVVCNTVKQAQEFYDELESECEVYLLHAKFISKHRKAKEKQILRDGETFLEDKVSLNDKKVIWISTQIVEASLDIDFDYLFTELVDLNSLFQRLGRCNRKGVKRVQEPNCFIYTEIEPNLFIKGSRGFIDRTLHDLSKEALLSHGDGIFTEREKVQLIELFLTKEKLKSGGGKYYEKYREMYDFIFNLYDGEKSWNQVKKEFRNIISYQAIPKTVFEKEEVIGRMISCYQRTKQNITQLNENKKKSLIENAVQHFMLELRLDKIRILDRIRQYCINVSFYDMIGAEKLDIDYEDIYIVPGDYSEERGFCRLDTKEIKKEEKSWDAFM